MCLCSYWLKSIFCGLGSDYFLGKGGDGIYYCGSWNGGFICYIIIFCFLYGSGFGWVFYVLWIIYFNNLWWFF